MQERNDIANNNIANNNIVENNIAENNIVDKHEQGFSITEMIIVIVIIGILLTSMLFSSARFMAHYRLITATEMLSSDLKATRDAAKNCGRTAEIRLDHPNPGQYQSFQKDKTGNWQPLSQPVRLAGGLSFPDNYTNTETGTTLPACKTFTFESLGDATSAGSAVLRSVAEEFRYVTVTTNGMIISSTDPP